MILFEILLKVALNTIKPTNHDIILLILLLYFVDDHLKIMSKCGFLWKTWLLKKIYLL